MTIYEMAGNNRRLGGELSERIRDLGGVLVDLNGQIYVGAAWSNNLVVREDGKIVGELRCLSSPHDNEMTPDGDIWLADAIAHNRVADPQGVVGTEIWF